MSYDEHLHQEMHRYLYARGDVDEPCPGECGCEWCERDDTSEAPRRAEEKGAAVDTSSLPHTAAPHSRDTHPGNWPGA